MTDSHATCEATQWTLVFRAAVENAEHGRPALEQIIRQYWKPLYSFARQRGLTPADAEDATQEFLSNLMDGRWLAQADPAKGRFRSYLLTSWKQFLIDQYRKENRIRRGGGMIRFSLDVAAGETAFQAASARQDNADLSFLRVWASSILDATAQRLSNDYAQRGHAVVCEALVPYLTSPIDQATYSDLSKQLGLSASSLRVALHRLRQRYGETLREVISETVEHPSEVDQELQELLRVLTSKSG